MNLNTIPHITDPMGRHWEQPLLSDIDVGDDYAEMSQETLDQLREYSSSYPSGVYIGKMWKSDDGQGGWILCWYGPDPNPDRVSINRRRVILEEEQWIIK